MNLRTENYRILITGACGSVGSSLGKFLLQNGHTLCLLDNSEDGLFRLGEELKRLNLTNFRLFHGDIRDKNRLIRAFRGVDIVFHCAAMKHVELSEYNPFEVVKTNIQGSQNIVEAAIDQSVKKVIFTSSDKAVNPTSTMGATKLVGERLFVAANFQAGGYGPRFSCVRFGNVLNSNGSILQIFSKQLLENKSLTITDLGMSRFFISMEEAVQLCITAAEFSKGGEIFVKNMGSVDILTLAKAFSKNENVPFEIIGMKPGEKLYEELITEVEHHRTVQMDDFLVILPHEISMLSEALQTDYSIYYTLPRMKHSLRSGETNLSFSEVTELLNKYGILND